MITRALFYTLVLINVDSKLTVFTTFETKYPSRIYSEKGNDDPPPSSDPAIASAAARLQICEDLTRSGIFVAYGMAAVDMDEVYFELRRPRYKDIFNSIYDTDQIPPAYNNPLRLFHVKIDEHSRPQLSGLQVVRKSEYLFICLLKTKLENEDVLSEGLHISMDNRGGHWPSSSSRTAYRLPYPASSTGALNRPRGEMAHQKRVFRKNRHWGTSFHRSDNNDWSATYRQRDLIPVYVSKLYDAYGGLPAFRFLFLEKNHNRSETEDDVLVMLAAESAQAYFRPDFNVELHYIELRKHHRPARSCLHDPVCELSMKNFEDHRTFYLCTMVLRSSYFDGRIQFPHKVIHEQDFWFTEQVFFQTREGAEGAAEKVYKEFVLPCYAITSDGTNEKVFYISRAYNPYQVFVFTKDPANDYLYLENLTTNVRIVHERYNFGDVEI